MSETATVLLDQLMNNITETFRQPPCLSPLRETTPLPCSPPPFKPPLDEETLYAVSSISNDPVEVAYERSLEIISQCGIEFVQELVIEEEVEKTITNEAEEQVVIAEEKQIRKEEKKRRKAEKRKLKAMEACERQASERDCNNNKKHKQIGEEISEELMQNEEEEKLEYLRRIQENRVVLNVGGLRFETSRLTLSKDPNLLLAKLFTKGSTIVPHGNSVFLDRDASHFRIILNYLRYDCQVENPATLPRERKYLLELKTECKYYQLHGLRKIVSKRIKQLEEIYGMD